MDNQSKIACCNICTLAQVMKTCATCPLNPANLKGLKPSDLALVRRVELLKPLGIKANGKI